MAQVQLIQDEWTHSGLTKSQKYYRRNKHVNQAYYMRRKYEQPERYLYESARCRSIKKKIEFSIDVEDIVIPDVCPILGIKLFASDGKATDNSPSLDRIDNAKGYVKGNVHVISNKANRLKGDAILDDIERLYTWMSKFG